VLRLRATCDPALFELRCGASAVEGGQSRSGSPARTSRRGEDAAGTGRSRRHAAGSLPEAFPRAAATPSEPRRAVREGPGPSPRRRRRPLRRRRRACAAQARTRRAPCAGNCGPAAASASGAIRTCCDASAAPRSQRFARRSSRPSRQARRFLPSWQGSTGGPACASSGPLQGARVAGLALGIGGAAAPCADYQPAQLDQLCATESSSGSGPVIGASFRRSGRLSGETAATRPRPRSRRALRSRTADRAGRWRSAPGAAAPPIPERDRQRERLQRDQSLAQAGPPVDPCQLGRTPRALLLAGSTSLRSAASEARRRRRSTSDRTIALAAAGPQFPAHEPLVAFELAQHRLDVGRRVAFACAVANGPRPFAKPPTRLRRESPPPSRNASADLPAAGPRAPGTARVLGRRRDAPRRRSGACCPPSTSRARERSLEQAGCRSPRSRRTSCSSSAFRDRRAAAPRLLERACIDQVAQLLLPSSSLQQSRSSESACARRSAGGVSSSYISSAT